jgi:hypothetical protein
VSGDYHFHFGHLTVGPIALLRYTNVYIVLLNEVLPPLRFGTPERCLKRKLYNLRDLAAAHTRQLKVAVWPTAQVGRVSPRPQDYRQPIASVGRMLLPLITVLGLAGCRYVLGPAVSERHALPARLPDTTKNHAPLQSRTPP